MSERGQIQNLQSLPTVLNHRYSFSFGGSSDDWSPIGFKNFFYAILTLGLSCFWTAPEANEYFYTRTKFGGQRFYYHGTTEGLLYAAMPVLGVHAFLFALMFGLVKYFPALSTPVYSATAILSMPLLFALKARLTHYRLNHLSLGRHRASFTLSTTQYVLWSCLGLTLTLLTLGVFYPVWRHRTLNMYFSHLKLGSLEFRFSSSLRAFAVDNLARI